MARLWTMWKEKYKKYKKKEHNQRSSVFKVLRYYLICFILFKCHRFIDKSNDFSFYLVVKRLTTTKNSVVKIQNRAWITNHDPLSWTLVFDTFLFFACYLSSFYTILLFISTLYTSQKKSLKYRNHRKLPKFCKNMSKRRTKT